MCQAICKITSVNGMDYTPDIRKRIVLIAREDIIIVCEKNYAEMLVNMIYGSGKQSFKLIRDSHLIPSI